MNWKTFLGGAALSAALASASWAATPALVEAAQNKDRGAMKTLLSQKADVKATAADGTTALHWAAHWNDLDMVNALLAAGADAKALNRYGVSPIGEAAAGSGGAVVERLLKAGADPNTLTTPEGETVLMTAARVGNLEAVKALLDKGANPNAKETYKGQTALMWAAAEGHADVVKALIAKGADPKTLSDDRDATLPKLPAGSPVAPVSRGGLSALAFAARQGQVEAADALIDAGANLNEKDVDGNSPLVLAILNKHFDLAKDLVNRGADVNAANKDGRAPLFTAVELRNEDYSPRPSIRTNDTTTAMEVIQLLVAKGANVNAQLTGTVELHKFAQDQGDKTLGAGSTAFMRAARSADIETMKLLLAHGADPKLAAKDGLNALMLAAGVGWADKVHGTEKEALEATRLCLDKGLDVNAATDKGDTALHGAAMRGGDTIIPLLVEKGANLNSKNKQDFTPYDIATGKGGFGGALREPRPSTMKVIQDLGGKAAGELAQATPPKTEAK